jgi:transcriptional regulator with XRE-family HTH domain
MTTLSERLACLRYVKGVSQRQVEAETGVSNAYISQLETGKIGDPGIGTIVKLADYYGATLEFIVRGEMT